LAGARADESAKAVDREQSRLGAKLREAREYLGLSQEFVAEQLAIPRASISGMETGKRKVSSLELRDLARLYKRPVAYLLAGDQDDSVEPEDETVVALYRTTRSLNEEDRQQVLRFAQFLKGAGKVPAPANRRRRA